jgi:hypothetical protein
MSTIRSLCAAAGFAVVCLISATAGAKGLDTPTLVAMCNNTDPAKPNNASECIAYLRGVYEGSTVGFYLGQSKILFCPKQPIRQSNELRATFLRYVRDHPDKQDNDPAFVAVKAFTDAYPCDDATPR